MAIMLSLIDKSYMSIRWKKCLVLEIQIYHVLCFQPIDLLPCSLDELRDHLAREGDLSLDGLKVLRDAEEERRGESIYT